MALNLNAAGLSEWDIIFVNQFGDESEMSGIVEQVSIFESIYNNCIIGNIKVKDGTGFVEANGIIGSGKEMIKIEIITPSLSVDTTANFEKQFVINSITNGQKENGYIIYDVGVVSPTLIKNNNTIISRSFSGMTSSEIVEYVAADIMEFGVDYEWEQMKEIEATKHTKNIVVPNWNPFQLMNFLAKNSVSLDNYSNYMFFENNEGFQFVTIDTLKNKEPMRELFLKNNHITDFHTTTSGRGVIDGSTMKDYNEIQRFDLSEGTMNGLYSNSLLTHNLITKKLDKYEVIYDGMMDTTLGEVGLNAGDLFTSNSEAHSGFMSSNYLYDIHDKGDKNHYGVYDMKKAELRNNIISFDIAGDSNIYAGDVLTLHIPTNIHQGEEAEDQYMTGEWFVSAIHHKINNTEYIMTLECMKDGFYSDPEVTISARG